nr:hypothetical protein [Thermosynechococcus sp. OHK43]
MIKVAKSLIYFFITGLLELGGAYFVWLWLREHKSIWYALGGAILTFYLWHGTDASTRAFRSCSSRL